MRQEPPKFTGLRDSLLRRFIYELQTWYANEMAIHPGSITHLQMFDRVQLAFPFETPAQIWWRPLRASLRREPCLIMISCWTVW